MTTTIYIETDIQKYKRTQEILEKFPKARIITIQRYSEVFNRKNQDFRKQKEQGKVFILAQKIDHFVLPVPFEYATQTEHNYYFSHLYNCPYDCEYCYLQGQYRSAYFVLFVNYEDFAAEIRKIAKSHHSERVTFFSGYDCDSLALEHVTGFAEYFISCFEQIPNAQMELRTKSAQVQSLLDLPTPKNTFVTWTLSPQEICEQWEHRAPNLKARIQALKKLKEKGWRIQIRLEPVIAFQGWKEAYEAFFTLLKKEIDLQKIEAIGFGQFRLPKDVFKKMKKMLPQSTLLSKHYELSKSGEVTYSQEKTKEITDFLIEQCSTYFLPGKILYHNPS